MRPYRIVMSRVEPLISNLIHPKAVCLDIQGVHNKQELIRFLAGLLFEVGKINSIDQFVNAVYQREKIGTTLNSDGIAFPHGESDTVISAGVAIGRAENGIFYETEDCGGGLAKIIILFAIPIKKEVTDQEGFQVLARLLVCKDFLESIRQAANFESILTAVRKYGDLLK